MTRSNDQSIGDAIRAFLHSYHLDEKVNERRLIHEWEAVVGRVVALHTRTLYIRNRVLFASLDSPALRNELQYSLEMIRESLNKRVGTTVIDDIVLK